MSVERIVSLDHLTVFELTRLRWYVPPQAAAGAMWVCA